jgi:hypothetical protein
MARFVWLGLPLALLAWAPYLPGAGGAATAAEVLPEMPAWTVEGAGADLKAAQREALKRGCDELTTYLGSLYGEIGWQPTPEYLLQTKIAHQIEQRPVELKAAPSAYLVVMRVELTRDQLREIQNLIREQRVSERHRLTALGLAAFVALVLVLLGYLRLDELTKGYFSTALGVLALLLAAGILGGVYVLLTVAV